MSRRSHGLHSDCRCFSFSTGPAFPRRNSSPANCISGNAEFILLPSHFLPASPSHLAQVFCRIVGAPPTEFRAELWCVEYDTRRSSLRPKPTGENRRVASHGNRRAFHPNESGRAESSFTSQFYEDALTKLVTTWTVQPPGIASTGRTSRPCKLTSFGEDRSPALFLQKNKQWENVMVVFCSD
jgi:hypothetical protein